MPRPGRARALTTTEQISAITHLVAALESLTNERRARNAPLVDWDLVREEFAWAPPPVQRVLDFVGRPRVSRSIQIARVAAAATLVVPSTGRRTRAAAGSFLALSSLVVNPRQHFGTDGSDQVAFTVQGVAAVARLSERQPKVVDTCLWFIALQSALSYFAAGVTKLAGPGWRSGEALPGILRTEIYGDEGAYRLTRRFPELSKYASHGVLLFECAFPVIFMAKGRAAPLMLAVSGSFHLANARVMGLSRFVWAFCSTYPAVLYVTRPNAIGTAEGLRGHQG